jgi:DNA helicase HerA-like ATPase
MKAVQKMNRIYGIVCGMSGMGKSYLVKNYLIPKLADKKPVIILDILGEYDGDFVHENFADFFNHIKKHGKLFTAVHVIRWKSDTDAINTIQLIRSLEKPISFVVEEGHVLFTDSDLKKSVKKSLKEITMFGRHHGIDTILCTQRPSNLTADVRSQAQFTIFFRLNDRADLDYARQKGGKGDHIEKTVAKLEKRQYYVTGRKPKGYSKLKINQVNSL